MNNQYLEKIAGNAYKRHMESKGLNTAGMSNQSLLAGIGQHKGVTALPAGDKVQVKARGLMGLGKSKVVGMAPSGRTISTGDSLAKGIAPRLAAFKDQKAKASAAAAAAAKPTGILGKALGMAKRHPVATAAVGGALAAGVASKAFSRKDQDSPAVSYAQY